MQLLPQRARPTITIVPLDAGGCVRPDVFMPTEHAPFTGCTTLTRASGSLKSALLLPVLNRVAPNISALTVDRIDATLLPERLGISAGTGRLVFNIVVTPEAICFAPRSGVLGTPAAAKHFMLAKVANGSRRQETPRVLFAGRAKMVDSTLILYGASGTYPSASAARVSIAQFLRTLCPQLYIQSA